MKKTLGILTIVLCLVITNMASVFALDQPEKPDTINNETITEYNQQVDEYNNYVDTYNAKVDSDYEEAYSAYEEEKANVESNNQFVDNVEAKVNADSSEARGFENSSTDELPTDWNDEVSENPKTIQIEKSETPAGETIKVINLHVYLKENVTYNDLEPTFYNSINNYSFDLSDNLKNNAVLTEWEVAEIDYDDTVTLVSESIAFAGNIVWINGKRSWMGAAPSPYFVRSIDGYTQGYWTPGGDILATTATEQEYGWSAGTAYTVHHAEETATSYYSENGVLKSEEITVRTTDKQSPKNIFALFTYVFTRLAAEPEKQELPEEPIKGEYLNKLDHLDLIEEPVVVPETPAEPTNSQPHIQTVVQTEDVVIAETNPPASTIKPVDTPKSAPISSWALINLICVIITCIMSIIMLFVRHKDKDDNAEDDNDEYNKPKTINKFVGIIIGLISVLIFILTEDMSLPMIMVDKWTIYMAIILIINTINAWFILRNKDEDEETAE